MKSISAILRAVLPRAVNPWDWREAGQEWRAHPMFYALAVLAMFVTIITVRSCRKGF